MSNGFSIAIAVHLMMFGIAGHWVRLRQGDTIVANFWSWVALGGCVWLGITLDRIIS
jgi:hypothetical protein